MSDYIIEDTINKPFYDEDSFFLVDQSFSVKQRRSTEMTLCPSAIVK
jgi:hypothetical protein